MENSSDISEITSVVNYDSNDFSFVDTVGSMIQNRDWSYGYRRFKEGFDNSETFFFKTLSAVGQEFGDTIYSNIQNYISYVSDVDTCKIQSLRSMMRIFNFKYTIFDDMSRFPIELQKLMDIFSINSKYLQRTGIIKREMISSLISADPAVIALDDSTINLLESYSNNTLNISSNGDGSPRCVPYKLANQYEQAGTILNLSRDTDMSAILSGFQSGYLSTYNSAYLFSNKSNYKVVLASDGLSVFNSEYQPLFDLKYPGQIAYEDDSAAERVYDIYARLSDDTAFDTDYLRKNLSCAISVAIANPVFTHDRFVFNDENYFQYVKNAYIRILYGYIALPYNIDIMYMTHKNKLYIYKYLTDDEYFEVGKKYKIYKSVSDSSDDIDAAILSVKLYNNIGQSFDEKKIIDDIDKGLDSLKNYSGAQLDVLNMEMSRRNGSLTVNMLDGFPSYYTTSQLTLKENQTRYSYYRKQKVLEYAKFVDNYYSQIAKNAKLYDIDVNYCEVSASSQKVINKKTRTDTSLPSDDINMQMIDVVAQYLAMTTVYIQKLRNEIKLQTQKNYMRGTNLLLIYIINEYLRDYAKHNSRLSNDILNADSMRIDPVLNSSAEKIEEIRDKLINHAIEDETDKGYSIDVNEYYDKTEYFNIKTNASVSSVSADDVNERYWELTSFENPVAMKYDGLNFKLKEIEKFYLSALNLNWNISGDLPAFLSTIYDLGADSTFIYGLSDGGQIYSAVLANGKFASDMYEELAVLSNANLQFQKKYMAAGDYTYPVSAMIDQINDVLTSYVYPNLSAKYFAGVSDLYNANMPDVETLCADMLKLSADYQELTLSTYPLYYNKSDCRFCYSDYDPTFGTYRHQWYNGNESVNSDSMLLFEHLTQLSLYSSVQNIRNFPIIDTLEYVQNDFNRISSDLQVRVIDDLVSEYGFIDIHAADLDTSLKLAYDFINNLITKRNEFLQNQLTSLQSQANDLKRAYDDLNNTFTQAVANFNDNNDGYKLGDSFIIWCSDAQTNSELKVDAWANMVDGGEFAKRVSAAKDIKEQHEYAINCKDPVFNAKYWYYGPFDDDDLADPYKVRTKCWGVGRIDVTPYNADMALAEKCNAVYEYITAPTSKTYKWNTEAEKKEDYYWEQISEYYGLQNEGLAAVVGNVQAGLADLEKQYENVRMQAENLFGIDTDFPAIDLIDRILALIEALTAVDETCFTDDEQIKKYKEYYSAIVSLSGEYMPVKDQFNKIFSNKDYAEYLVDFSNSYQLTQEIMNDLCAYIDKKDTGIHADIAHRIGQLMGIRFIELLDRKTHLEEKFIGLGVPGVTVTGGTSLETYIGFLKQGLETDLYNKYAKAVQSIDENKYDIANNYGTGYINIMSSEVSSKLSTDENFANAVSERLAELNFFGHDIYNNYKQMFLTYCGCDFCYDPYYNMKNTTHPSYQIHPYLWNFVEKIINRDTLITKGFNADVILELEEIMATDKIIRKYIGEYGQTVDVWLNANNNVIDYSGYGSGYEKNANFSSKLNSVCEVVDYEGAFFPPAVAMFRYNTETSISSVYARKSWLNIYYDCHDGFLNDDVTSYVECYSGTKIISGQRFYHDISGYIEPYINDQTVSGRLDRRLIGSQLSDLTWRTVTNEVSAALAETPTFYEKYYKHLELTENERIRIAYQLREYKDRIFDITESRDLRDQYDIYKYGQDLNNVNYILYKKYDYSQVESVDKLTYRQKRDTKGQMWIRLADHPIAFPAFTGTDPAYYIYDTDFISPAIVSKNECLALINGASGVTWKDIDKTKVSRINDDMIWFYDFEISQNRANISFVIKDFKYDRNKKFFDRYELGMIIAGRIEQYQDIENDIEYMMFSNAQGSTVDYVDFHKNSIIGYHSPDDIIDAELSAGVYYPALIGHHLYDNSAVNYVYAYKFFKTDEAGEDDTKLINADSDDALRIFSVSIDNGSTFKKIPAAEELIVNTGRRKIAGRDACVGFDSNRSLLVLAFGTDFISHSISVDSETALNINISANADGAVPNDPVNRNFTSHDVFVDNITMAEFVMKSKNYIQRNIYDYNMNADIAYIPSYSGYDHMFDMPVRYGKYDQATDSYSLPNDYYSLELLGHAGDIGAYLPLINPDPDPYFDYASICENYEFGRVYEDYKSEYEKTFTLVSNPSLNSNSPNSDGHSRSKWNVVFVDGHGYQDSIIQWSVNLNNLNFRPYNMHDIKTMQILIYNYNTLGKSPYYVGSLYDFIDNEKDLNYDESENVTAERPISVISEYGGQVTVTGTHNDIRMKSYTDTNHIRGIKRMTAQLAADEKHLDNAKLIIKFYVPVDSGRDQYAFVKQDDIKILLYNAKDLEMFEYYHMFDAYGAINCKYLASEKTKPDIPDDGRGWGIHYPEPRREELTALNQSYFRDLKQFYKYLSDIHLSDYDYLSDVYIFQGNDKLSFKYDEELRFPVSSDLYYYPTLNVSYPKSAADFVDTDGKFAIGVANTDVLAEAFSDNNTFILQYDDPERLADKIGIVDIPVIFNNADSLRAYEDYLCYDDRLSLDNFNKYDIGDPRMYEYVHFATDGFVGSDQISVPDSYVKNMQVDDFIDSCYANLSAIAPKISEQLITEGETEYVHIELNGKNCDLGHLARIYANYSVNNDTGDITLYFNYFNYVDSPYIKYDDKTRLVVDTIRSTYLKLEPDQNGVLDIVLQVKYYNGSTVYGYKNIKILSYRIFNISDDKPKFLIQKIYEMNKNAGQKTIDRADVRFEIPPVVKDISEITDDEMDKLIDAPFWVNVYSDKSLSSPYSFYLDYPSHMLSIDYVNNPGGIGYVIDRTASFNGMLKVNVINSGIKSYRFDFRTLYTARTIKAKYLNKTYSVSIDEADIYDSDGLSCRVQLTDSYFGIRSTQEFHDILAVKKTQTDTDRAVSLKMNTQDVFTGNFKIKET